MKLEFSQLSFAKYSNIDLKEISLAGAELFLADRQTDGGTSRHGEANSCFSQICELV
jgi:hypothetical protein